MDEVANRRTKSTAFELDLILGLLASVLQLPVFVVVTYVGWFTAGRPFDISAGEVVVALIVALPVSTVVHTCLRWAHHRGDTRDQVTAPRLAMAFHVVASTASIAVGALVVGAPRGSAALAGACAGLVAGVAQQAWMSHSIKKNPPMPPEERAARIADVKRAGREARAAPETEQDP